MTYTDTRCVVQSWTHTRRTHTDTPMHVPHTGRPTDGVSWGCALRPRHTINQSSRYTHGATQRPQAQQAQQAQARRMRRLRPPQAGSRPTPGQRRSKIPLGESELLKIAILARQVRALPQRQGEPVKTRNMPDVKASVFLFTQGVCSRGAGCPFKHNRKPNSPNPKGDPMQWCQA